MEIGERYLAGFLRMTRVIEGRMMRAVLKLLIASIVLSTPALLTQLWWTEPSWQYVRVALLNGVMATILATVLHVVHERSR